MINSLVKELVVVDLPTTPAFAYMIPFHLENKLILVGDVEPFQDVLNKMLSLSPIKTGEAYLTIDSRIIRKGNSHRRPGPHVDGNYLFQWGTGGGNGWLTGTKGRILTPEDHRLQYESKLGGMLIVASHEGCRVWEGQYKQLPKQGGDCSHLQLDTKDSFVMKKNTIYLTNSTCIHESLKMSQDVMRSLIRITLPATEEVFK